MPTTLSQFVNNNRERQKRYLTISRKIKTGLALLLGFGFLLFSDTHANAKELSANISGKGSSITVTSKDGSPIGSIYVKWNKSVKPYELITDSETLSCGEYGFLHEFIALDNPSTAVTFSLPAEDPMGIYSLRIFTDNNVPADVQIWQPPCERADILLVSAHSDDEILFMGGIIPTYGAQQGARVQVAYMTEFWTTTPVREHEKLDGLWEDGLRYYPVCGNFKDVYSENLADAEKKYDLDAMTSYVAEIIDLFQPQVVVTHDFNGEYGHGFHMLTAKAVAAALETAAFDVPKAYFHLYPENMIHMELNVPLPSMGDRTALDVAKSAYLQHKSQQWCWFYVSDTYKYSCADFGLYKTTVGVDEEPSMLDHIVLYAEQERLEEERLEALRLEEERLEKERQEQAVQAKVAAIRSDIERQQKEAEDSLLSASRELEQIEQDLKAARNRTAILMIGCCILLLLCILYLFRYFSRSKQRQREWKDEE